MQRHLGAIYGPLVTFPAADLPGNYAYVTNQKVGSPYLTDQLDTVH